jgi:phosphoribosylformylglycinamidine synthase
MSPEDILLSESQERMLLVCEPGKFKDLEKIFHLWGLDAVKIGEVTGEKVVDLQWRGECLTRIDPDILVENAPQYQRPWKQLPPQNRVTSRAEYQVAGDLGQNLKDLRGCSREWIYRQYDSRVGAATMRDCRDSVGVLRLKDSGRSLGIVLGCRPHVMRFDARTGGIDAVAFPALELALKGFTTLAVTDCLNYGNPEREHVMSEFVASLEGMSSMCRELEAPIISGNVSFYNETMGQNITPTPSTGLVGLRDSIEGIPLSTFDREGLEIFVLRTAMVEFGGLTQELTMKKSLGRGDLELKAIADFIRLTRELADFEGVSATRAIGKFGLSYALARMSSEGIGARIDFAGLRLIRQVPDKSSLFEEHLFEAIFAVRPERATEFAGIFQGRLNGNQFELHKIGQTVTGRLEIASFIESSTEDLTQQYISGWRQALESDFHEI